jgi:hypothetical protein
MTDLSELPFACTDESGAGSPRQLLKKRVTQCALSRICGSCGDSLDRPVAFVGSPDEAARNAFHFPPMHEGCARALLTSYAGSREAVLGQLEPLDTWVLVTTSGFELLRPQSYDVDRRSAFEPNSVITEERLTPPAR